MPIEGLSTDPLNARLHDERSLRSIGESLTRFGQQAPVLVDAEGVCIAGSGRLEAARALGWTHIAAINADLDGAERTAYAIADNRTADLAEWDVKALARLVAECADDDVEALLFGFEGDELDKLLSEPDPAPGEEAKPDGPRGAVLPEGLEGDVLITCASEADQRAVYTRWTTGGYKCRVVSM